VGVLINQIKPELRIGIIVDVNPDPAFHLSADPDKIFRVISDPDAVPRQSDVNRNHRSTEPPRLNCECPRPHFELLKLLNFHLNADLDPALKLLRIRIRNPELN
jgi:hypothetical protein